MGKPTLRLSPEVREGAVRLVQEQAGHNEFLWTAIKTDAAKIGGIRFPVLIGDELKRIPDHVNHAGLNFRFRENRVYRLGKARQPFDGRDREILRPMVLKLIYNAKPKLRTFISFRPDAEKLLLAVHPDCQGEGKSLLLDLGIIFHRD
jgi:hypothetical protein